MKTTLTLCFIRDADSILLGMKKRGFGRGKWNGLGGKCEPGESLEESVAREVLEKSGLKIQVTPNDKMGVIDFVYTNQMYGTHQVHIYSVTTYQGKLIESDEIFPQWFAIKDIPYKKMWEDDIYWLPLLLEGKHFVGEFNFDKHTVLADHTVKIQAVL